MTADVVGRAGIALLDPATNATLAGGITDAAGVFTLYQSNPAFTPANGAYYILEDSKRHDRAQFVRHHRQPSLRSFGLSYEPTGWP